MDSPVRWVRGVGVVDAQNVNRVPAGFVAHAGDTGEFTIARRADRDEPTPGGNVENLVDVEPLRGHHSRMSATPSRTESARSASMAIVVFPDGL